MFPNAPNLDLVPAENIVDLNISISFFGIQEKSNIPSLILLKTGKYTNIAK